MHSSQNNNNNNNLLTHSGNNSNNSNSNFHDSYASSTNEYNTSLHASTLLLEESNMSNNLDYNKQQHQHQQDMLDSRGSKMSRENDSREFSMNYNDFHPEGGGSSYQSNMNMSNSNMSNNMSNNNMEESSNNNDNDPLLPPDWIALEDPDSGDVYYANEVTGESTWDKPAMTVSNNNGNNNNDDIMPRGPQSLPPEEESSRDIVSVATPDTINDDDLLPVGWVELEDADSGDPYYFNEDTMETTWDRPSKVGVNNSQQQQQRQRQQQHHQQPLENDDDDGGGLGNSQQLSENNEDTITDGDGEDLHDDLPPGWEALIDPSSGDYYYAHDSGATQWDRPVSFQSSDAVNSVSQHGSSIGGDTNDHDTNDNDNDEDNTLPSSSDDTDNGNLLPPGWFMALDEASGDTYYCNEATGETTWDRPSYDDGHGGHDSNSHHQPLSENDDGTNSTYDDANNNSQQLSVSESTYNDSNVSGNDGNIDNLPPGWFAVTDPASEDTYYCNEETGQTTWDHPSDMLLIDGGDNNQNNNNNLLMQSQSEVASVYEDDSVTSSQAY